MTTYRFKYSQQFVNEIADFARVHQYDDRHILKRHGRDGFIRTKLQLQMKLICYKMLDTKEMCMNVCILVLVIIFERRMLLLLLPKKRRDYISIDHDLIIIMDTHIRRVITTSNKPSIAYEQFCIEYENDINEESTRLLDLNVLNIMISIKN